MPFIQTRPLTTRQWSTLLSSLSALVVFVNSSSDADFKRFLQGLLRETRVVDCLCALLRFPFDETEFTTLTSREPLTAALKLVYNAVFAVVEVRCDVVCLSKTAHNRTVMRA